MRGFKIAAARKMLQENRNGAEKSQKVMETLISVRNQLKELKKQLDGLVLRLFVMGQQQQWCVTSVMVRKEVFSIFISSHFILYFSRCYIKYFR